MCLVWCILQALCLKQNGAQGHSVQFMLPTQICPLTSRPVRSIDYLKCPTWLFHRCHTLHMLQSTGFVPPLGTDKSHMAAPLPTSRDSGSGSVIQPLVEARMSRRWYSLALAEVCDPAAAPTSTPTTNTRACALALLHPRPACCSDSLSTLFPETQLCNTNRPQLLL